MKIRPKTLPSQLNCLNDAENRRFISFFVQKKKAYRLILARKKPNSINIYRWDKTAQKSRFFEDFGSKFQQIGERWGKKFGHLSERKFPHDFKNAIGFLIA